MAALLYLLGFSTATAYWPGILDATTAPRWAAMVVLVPFCLVAAVEVPRLSKALLACIGVAALSMLWAPAWWVAADEFIKLVFLAGGFWIGMTIQDSRPLWVGIIAGVLISAVMVILQSLGFELVQSASRPSGLFGNKNFFAEAALVATIAAFMLRAWWVVALLVLTLLLADSKAVFAALAVVCAAWFYPRRPMVSFALIVAVLAAGALLWVSGSESLAARLEIWSVAFSGLTPFGHGIGSFTAAYSGYEYTHNEPLQLIYEYGLLAAPFFLLAYLVLSERSDAKELEWLVCVGVGTVSLFAFPLHLPLTALAAAVAAGSLAGLRTLVVRRHAVWGGAANAALR